MCEAIKTRTVPCCYPMNASAGIYDAQAFKIGKSETVHLPYRYPDGKRVVAACGAYGDACEADTRLAVWADGDITCDRCNGLDN